MTAALSERGRAQLALVEEHVRRENAHDSRESWPPSGRGPDMTMSHGASTTRDETPCRAITKTLLVSLPDLRIDITRRLVSEDGVALEVRVSGTHLGPWRGLPPTGRPVSFPLCGLYTFDEDGKLAGERIYYDRGYVLQQVGLFRDPQSLLGRLEILLAHPVTVARAYARKLTLK